MNHPRKTGGRPTYTRWERKRPRLHITLSVPALEALDELAATDESSQSQTIERLILAETTRRHPS